MTLRTQKSFTLMELMVTMIIVTVFAVAGVTSFNKTMKRSYVDEAILQLTLIHGANQVYKAKHGQYWPNDGSANHTNIAEINNNLRLSLSGDRYNYLCFGDGSNWTCELAFKNPATYTGTVVVSQGPISATNPTVLLDLNDN